MFEVSRAKSDWDILVVFFLTIPTFPTLETVSIATCLGNYWNISIYFAFKVAIQFQKYFIIKFQRDLTWITNSYKSTYSDLPCYSSVKKLFVIRWLFMWRFPKVGVPQSSSKKMDDHFHMAFHRKPWWLGDIWGPPWLRKPPLKWVSMLKCYYFNHNIGLARIHTYINNDYG